MNLKRSFDRTIFLLNAFVLLAVFLSGCSSESGTAHVTLRGVVTDHHTGEPHQGVTVRIGSSTAVTGKDGSFFIAGLAPGQETLIASLEGHADFNKEIEIQSGQVNVHNIALLDLLPLANHPATNPYWTMTGLGNGQRLADWNPESDPNLIFYRPAIPLASRIQAGPQNGPGWTAFYSFSTDRYPMLMTLGANEATSPPGGDDNQRLRNFTYWQNTERFVAFGGYFRRGEIQLPSPGWIRAAHQNGVPILATLFFNEDNQDQKNWIRNNLSNPEISRKLAGQMALLAKEYGFDGFLINQETTNHTGSKLEIDTICATFVQNIHRAGIAQGYPVTITWYQVFSEDFTPNMLIDPDTGRRNTDFVYVDHGWQDLDLIATFKSEYAAFPLTDVEIGINIASGYKYDNPDYFQGSRHDYTENPPKERLKYIKDHGGTSQAGLFALHAITTDAKDGNDQELVAIDQKRSGYMDELANYAKLHTAITCAPFVTYFNTGQGDRYFRDGSPVLSKKWSDMGQQDMLPTYRQNLAFAYDDAYYGGSALKVTGSATLYEASIPIDAGSVFEVIYKFRNIYEAASCKLVLTLDSGKTVELPLSTSALRWTSSKIDLGNNRGQKIVRISASCSSQMDLLLGKIFAGVPDDPQPLISTGVSTAQASDGYYSTLVWNAGGNNYAYEIYDGEDFLGRASNHAFVAFGSRRPVNLRVVPVSFSGKR